MNGMLRIERDGVLAQTLPIEGRPMILGGDPEAALRPDEADPARQICRLEIIGRQLVITDLGAPQGIFARGQRASRLVLEADEDFFLGPTRIRFSLARVGGLNPSRSTAAGEGWDATLVPPPNAPAPRAPVPVRGVTRSVRAAAVEMPRPAADRESADAPRVEGYRIVRRLGAGSMGVTYLATSVETGADCVLKTIDLEERAGAAVFFIREAQMGLTMNHPNLVRVTDFGESGGLLFLIMEHLAGGSLLDRIERDGPIGNADAGRHLRQLADALEHAARRRFVHRDIKPANVLLTAEGVPKLGDFGVAKMLASTEHARITRTGEPRGTPMYMAPEVLTRGARGDIRSDIYSLGATYHHALAGCPPFPAESMGRLVAMVAKEEPVPIEGSNPRVHPELANVVRRMMRKEPADRYPDPGSLIADLERVAADLGA